MGISIKAQTYDVYGNPISRNTLPKISKTAAYDSTFSISDTLHTAAGFEPGSGQLSKNGLEYYFSMHDFNNGSELLYMANRASLQDTFNAAQLLNGAVNDQQTLNIQPSVSEDKLTIVFVRSAENNWNFNDLYLAIRPDTFSVFDSVRALDEINIVNQADAYPYITPDGLRLYFTRGSGSSSREFLMSSRTSVADSFLSPVGLAITISTSARSAWLSRDELEMYFSEADTSSVLYYTSRISLDEVFSAPMRLPGVRGFGYVTGPSLIENQLFLASSPYQAVDNILIFLANPVVSSIAKQKRSIKLPKSAVLSQNYPNPFNPSTKISYTLSKGGWVILDIYDIRGRKVHTLINEKQSPNSYDFTFFAENLNNGIYFYTLKVNNLIIDTKKMILIK